jgi:hypothetical protein
LDTILVSYVGNNDPFGRRDSEGIPTTGPVLALLEHLAHAGQSPSVVLLCATRTHLHRVDVEAAEIDSYRQEGMETKATELASEIHQRHGITPEVIFINVNPTVLDEVVSALQSKLGPLRPEDAVFHVNLSSGTPAIAAALTFLVDSGFFPSPSLWQVIDPNALRHHQTGQLLAVPRARAVHLAYLSERARLAEAVSHLRAMAFMPAALAFKVVAERSLLTARRPRAMAMARLAEAFAKWDRAEFEQAQATMADANRMLREAKLWRIREIVEAEREALADLVRERQEAERNRLEPRETLRVNDDLLASVLRRRAAGDFEGCVMRARRLYEGVINYFLYEAGGSPRLLPDVFARLNALQALVGNEIGSTKLRREDLAELRQQYVRSGHVRNRAYGVHGLSAVASTDATAVVEEALELMRRVDAVTGQRRELLRVAFSDVAIVALAEAADVDV